MLEFRTNRAPGEAFPSRDDYLRKKTAHPRSFEAFLCHAMERVNRPLTEYHPKDLEQCGESNLTTGFPWLTLVLGSGCLEARAMDDLEAIQEAPAAVHQLLQDEPLLRSGEEPGSVAQAFARSLIADRLGGEVLARGPACGNEDPGARSGYEGSSNGELDKITADVVLLAALLTRFYYRTRAISPQGTSRSGFGVAELGGTYDDAETEALVLDPALTLLDALLSGRRTESSSIGDVLTQVLEQIRADLRPHQGQPRLQGMRLKILNELTWHRLTGKSLVYPGWGDLLLDLSLHGGLPPLRHGQPRPTFSKLNDGASLIHKRYENVTARSWKTLPDVSSGCETFYERAAAVIVEQAILRRKTKSTWKPPIAAAFVTTFDLELEMALLTHPKNRPFVVAVPIYVAKYEAAEDEWRASLLWLGCVVEPPRSEEHATRLKSLLKPSKWLVLSGNPYYKSRVFGVDPDDGEQLLYADLPTVVRLGGCPLIELPNVEDKSYLGRCIQAVLKGSNVDLVKGPEDGPTDGFSNGKSIDIEHALLLDEYAAVHQNAIDRYAYSPAETRNKHTFGLPREMTGAPKPEWMTRFWMVLGVQMGDSAVRYRIASHLAPPLEPRPSTRQGRPNRSGVVINRRLDAADQELLAWLGFDTVAARCDEFAEDLEHYVDHLREPAPRGLPDEACPLK